MGVTHPIWVLGNKLRGPLPEQQMLLTAEPSLQADSHKKCASWGWRDGSVGKTTDCSSRVPRFNLHFYTATHTVLNSSSKASKALSLLTFLTTGIVHDRQTDMQANIHTYKIHIHII